jgi:ribonuclease P protein component
MNQFVTPGPDFGSERDSKSRKQRQNRTRPFALTASRHLYLRFALTLSRESGAAIFHAQAYIPTQPAQAKQEARVSHAYEDPGRPEGDFPPPRQRTEAGLGEAWLPRVAFPVPLTATTVETLSCPPVFMGSAGLAAWPDYAMPPMKAARFPRAARLLRHADFERVYKEGRRHFSASLTVFYRPRADESAEARTETSAPHGLRIGFTVGRALGGAVQRNKMKRRLREAVRLSGMPSGVAADVVINPKKSLLTADFAAVVNEVGRAFAVIEEKLSQTLAEKAGSEAAAKKIAESRKTLRLRSGQAPHRRRS